MVRRDWSLLSKELGDFCLSQILSGGYAFNHFSLVVLKSVQAFLNFFMSHFATKSSRKRFLHSTQLLKTHIWKL